MPLGSVLTATPKMWTIGGRFHTRAHVLLRAATLFSYDRTVTVDRAARTVTLRTQQLWAWKNEREVSFRDVSHVDLRHRSLELGGRHDTFECYEQFTVSLVIKPCTNVPLFSFRSDLLLTREIGMLDLAVSFGDDRHEDAAQAFAARLAEWIGVSLGPPVKHYATDDGTRYFCADCGRASGPGRANCLYCGGELEAVVAVPETARDG